MYLCHQQRELRPETILTDMTISEKRTIHHGAPFFGLGVERVDFEITAHKRYDEKRKPVRKTKDGRNKDQNFYPLRIKSKSRLNDFQ